MSNPRDGTWSDVADSLRIEGPLRHDGLQRVRTSITAGTLLAADLDGDGADELIVAGRQGLEIYRIGSDGTLVEHGAFPRLSANGICVADVDSDLQPEILIADDEGLTRVHLDSRGSPDADTTFTLGPLQSVAVARWSFVDNDILFSAVVFLGKDRRVGWTFFKDPDELARVNWGLALPDATRLVTIRDESGRDLVVAVGAELVALRHDSDEERIVEAMPRLGGLGVRGDAFVERRSPGGDRLWVVRADGRTVLALEVGAGGWRVAQTFGVDVHPTGLCVLEGGSLWVAGDDFVLHCFAPSAGGADVVPRRFPLVTGVGGCMVPLSGPTNRGAFALLGGAGDLGWLDEARLARVKDHSAPLADPWRHVALVRPHVSADAIALGIHPDNAALMPARVRPGAKPELLARFPLEGKPLAVATVRRAAGPFDDVLVLTSGPPRLSTIRLDAQGVLTSLHHREAPSEVSRITVLDWGDGASAAAVFDPLADAFWLLSLSTTAAVDGPVRYPISGGIVAVAAWMHAGSRRLLVLTSRHDRVKERGCLRAFGFEAGGSLREVTGAVLPSGTVRDLTVLRKGGCPWAAVVGCSGSEGIAYVLLDGRDFLEVRTFDFWNEVVKVGALDLDGRGDDLLLVSDSGTQCVSALAIELESIRTESTFSTLGECVDVAWTALPSGAAVVGLPSDVAGSPNAAIRSALYQGELDAIAIVRFTLEGNKKSVGATALPKAPGTLWASDLRSRRRDALLLAATFFVVGLLALWSRSSRDARAVDPPPNGAAVVGAVPGASAASCDLVAPVLCAQCLRRSCRTALDTCCADARCAASLAGLRACLARWVGNEGGMTGCWDAFQEGGASVRPSLRQCEGDQACSDCEVPVDPSLRPPSSTVAAATIEGGSGWSVTAERWVDSADRMVRVACPPGRRGRVVGTDQYAVTSSVCEAAVHAGMFGRDGRPDDLPVVTIRFGPDVDRFVGSERHGARSRSSRHGGRCFTFVQVEHRGGTTP